MSFGCLRSLRPVCDSFGRLPDRPIHQAEPHLYSTAAPRTGGTMSLLASADGFDTEPAWSPDGKNIAFVRGAAVKIVRVADGQDAPLPKALQTGGTYAVNKLEFAADGKRLLGAFRVD